MSTEPIASESNQNSWRNTNGTQKGENTTTNNSKQNGRNKRLIANIQATLMSSSPNQQNASLKVQKKKLNTPKYSLKNIEEAMERIQLADTDASVSLSDVRPFLCDNVKKLNEEDVQALCTCLCKAAVEQNNCYYIVDLCIDLVDVKSFQTYMGECLKEYVSEFLTTRSEETRALPEFLAQLAVARWPRGRGRAIEDSNAILYTVMNTILGWTQFVTQNDEENEDDELSEEKLELIVTCTEAIYTFCMFGQRSLWLSFPETFDNIYAATKSLLISNIPLKRFIFHSFIIRFLLQIIKVEFVNAAHKFIKVDSEQYKKIHEYFNTNYGILIQFRI